MGARCNFTNSVLFRKRSSQLHFALVLFVLKKRVPRFIAGLRKVKNEMKYDENTSLDASQEMGGNANS